MSRELRWFGEGLPYLPYKDVKGSLIAIEGTDGVGRSTQVDLLRRWLQVNGYGVVETGWTRSNLVRRALDMAKAGNLLNRMTFSLLYAADFADRLENVILPALRSGFVVLTDRYIYTAFVRDCVRGADSTWIRNIFGFAPVPDLVVYLKITVDNLIPRVIESGGMNYWESGMDLRMGDDIFDSFKVYQSRVLEEYDRMAQEFKFEVVDANRGIEEIQADLQERISKVLPIRVPASLPRAVAGATGTAAIATARPAAPSPPTPPVPASPTPRAGGAATSGPAASAKQAATASATHAAPPAPPQTAGKPSVPNAPTTG